MRILLTGAGSGGHIYPLISVAEELVQFSQTSGRPVELSYMGPRDSFTKLLEDRNIRIFPIPGAKLRRYLSFRNILDIPKFFLALVEAFWKVFFLMPDVVFSKGGTGAFVVVFAAWFYRIPIVIHESDAQPGLTNLLSRFFARRIAIGFEYAARYFRTDLAAVTGNPVRRELVEDHYSKEVAKRQLGFDPNEPLAVILGGSQGSMRINEFVISVLPQILKEAQVYHQTGSANYADIEKLSRAMLLDVPLNVETRHPYKAVPYIESDIGLVMSAADIVVSRAGAGTIFEIAAFGVPSIVIPLSPEASSGHQRLNAYEYAKTGAAIVIEEDNLLPGIFIKQIHEILKDPTVKEKMGAAAKSFFKPQAAESIAQEIVRLALS